MRALLSAQASLPERASNFNRMRIHEIITKKVGDARYEIA
jgi:hypothetical protein